MDLFINMDIDDDTILFIKSIYNCCNICLKENSVEEKCDDCELYCFDFLIKRYMYIIFTIFDMINKKAIKVN